MKINVGFGRQGTADGFANHRLVVHQQDHDMVLRLDLWTVGPTRSGIQRPIGAFFSHHGEKQKVFTPWNIRGHAAGRRRGFIPRGNKQ